MLTEELFDLFSLRHVFRFHYSQINQPRLYGFAYEVPYRAVVSKTLRKLFTFCFTQDAAHCTLEDSEPFQQSSASWGVEVVLRCGQVDV